MNCLDFDVIVIGGGHAGCEAAYASSKLGKRTGLLTISIDFIAKMSCNPAIGGIAKSHIVKEIDALGGLMAKITDHCGIHYRKLNTKKGRAVQATRVQTDKQMYSRIMKNYLETCENLFLKEEIAEKIKKKRQVFEITTNVGNTYAAKTVIVTTGTFLNGTIYIGLNKFSGGRLGEMASEKLAQCIKEFSLDTGRLKTGTPPRINKKTIDFSRMDIQPGDEQIKSLSFYGESNSLPQVNCYISYTNEQTKKIILGNMDKSPLYQGMIKGIGPRYCPSIEDKIVRFKDKNRHQIFVEPEGLENNEIYLNGLSTSLPYQVQYDIIRTVKGLENAEIIRPGYAIEYDFVKPYQLTHGLMVKKIPGLFLAGQINGTSGYEEAGCQGLIAGINASLYIDKKNPFTISRREGYTGVLIDDLVTKSTDEPYRMFTSRAEYRLLLRENNADLRLSEKGYNIGLLGRKSYKRMKEKQQFISETIDIIKKTRISPNQETNQIIEKMGTTPIKKSYTLEEILKRPEIKISSLVEQFDIVKLVNSQYYNYLEEVEEEIKYQGYILKKEREDRQRKKYNQAKIPEEIDYDSIKTLSNEVKEKIKLIKPTTISELSNISGVTPSAVDYIIIHLKNDQTYKNN